MVAMIFKVYNLTFLRKKYNLGIITFRSTGDAVLFLERVLWAFLATAAKEPIFPTHPMLPGFGFLWVSPGIEDDFYCVIPVLKLTFLQWYKAYCKSKTVQSRFLHFVVRTS